MFIELPYQEWTLIFEQLLQTSQNPTTKHASIQALGFICQGIVRLLLVISLLTRLQDRNIAQEHINKILTAIISGVHDADCTTAVSACRALSYSLDLAAANIKIEVIHIIDIF